MALSAQDLRNGLAAIEQLTFKGTDCAAAVALMDRYRAEIRALSATPQPVEAATPTDRKTNGEGHAPEAVPTA